MPGDDVEKLLTLETTDRPRPSKRRRRKFHVSRMLFCILFLSIFYLLFEPRGKPSLPGTLNALDPVLSDASIEYPSTTLLQNAGASDGERKDDNLAEYSSWPTTSIASSLTRLFCLLRDEVQTENLLRPIDATGEARLHELGLRTRYFKKMFEAWEKAHLVFNEDGTALKTRDNILKYLEQHPEIAGHMGMARAKVVHDYKISKWVYNRLSTLLFSWTAPYHKDLMALHAQFYGAERGIVMLAGDLQAAFLFTSISVIRQLGCHLPIEVFHYGDGDLTKSVRSQLEALPGVTTRDLSRMLDGRALTLSGWAGKPFAMLLSTFRHVIFIDADALFFQNPEILLEDEAYRETGALFFKDRMLFAESKRQWLQDVLPKPLSDNVLKNRFWTGESEHMQESGVVVVDKWRHFVALLLVARLNGLDRDGDEEKGIQGVYDMVFGDKETFWLGWELAGDIDYAFHDGSTGTMGVAHPVKDVPGWNGDILVATGPPRYTICAPQLLHLDRHDRPLWFNGWILPTKYDNDGEPAAFETFLQEPREVRGPNAWQLHENNVCCLTSEYKTEFTPEERKTLDDMIAIRRRLGVVGSESDSG